MRKIRIASLLTLVLITSSVSTALAKDLCVSLDTNEWIVLKKVKALKPANATAAGTTISTATTWPIRVWP